MSEALLLAGGPLASLAEDYGEAVLHLAWGSIAEGGEPYLLFGWVELLPAEVPPPFEALEMPKSSGRFRVVHVVTPTEVALEWYLSVRSGIATVPDESGALVVPVALIASLAEEPFWPQLVCGTEAVPFVPEGWDFPRVHHLVPVGGEEQLVAPPDEVVAFVSKYLHFSLGEFPEYYGSVHLVAPNPVFRDAHQKLRTGASGGDELWIQLEPRHGKSVEGLTIIVKQDRPTGAVFHTARCADGKICRIPLVEPALGLNIAVNDPARGTLYALSSVVFNISATLSTHLVVETRHVAAPHGDYDVPLRGDAITSHVGKTDEVRSATRRMRLAGSTRKSATPARFVEQYWLDSRDEALKVIRSLVHRASNAIVLVDQWFTHIELIDFMVAFANRDVSLRILCGSEVHPSKALGMKAKGGYRAMKTLQQELDGLKSQGVHNPIDVRIMQGAGVPPIHDRFLFCDHDVWSIGASLNHLGERGSVVVRLPVPQQVVDPVERVWHHHSTPLATWLVTHQNCEQT